MGGASKTHGRSRAGLVRLCSASAGVFAFIDAHGSVRWVANTGRAIVIGDETTADVPGSLVVEPKPFAVLAGRDTGSSGEGAALAWSAAASLPSSATPTAGALTSPDQRRLACGLVLWYPGAAALDASGRRVGPGID